MQRNESNFHQKFNKNRRNKRKNDADQNAAGCSGKNGRVRRPPGLRGKEIGLWYARQNRKRREKQVLAKVLLTNYEQKRIESLISTSSIYASKSIENLSITDDQYAHIKDSYFKRSFLSNISGSLIDKLQSCASEITTNEYLDARYLMEHQNKVKNELYNKLKEVRVKLPSYSMKSELLRVIDQNQIVLVSGETGCGKTTQLPQFILDEYIESGKGSACRIICTQPRRISAISVAERVAEERGEELGDSVGYQIRLEQKLPRDKGSVTFCTTGVILKKMESNPSLSNVSHLIIDEIHERSIPSDFLITIIKEVVKKRTDLKVILMSATLNADKFSQYFDNCPHVNIPGFTYKVDEFYLEDVLQLTKFKYQNPSVYKKYYKTKEERDYEYEFDHYIKPYLRDISNKYDKNVLNQLENPLSEKLNVYLITELVKCICKSDSSNGSILIFVPGYQDITNLSKELSISFYIPKLHIIIPLHSQLPTVDQKQVFEPPPPGKRKIIISTNIAETSITIDDVTFVIDTGKMKRSDFNTETNTQVLDSCWITQANADQRKGRAGRTKPGVCYRLYTKIRYSLLERFERPEITRTRLESTILQAKILQLGRVVDFFPKLMDPPSTDALDISLDLLTRLDALDNNEYLTPLGYHLAKIPVAPQIGKMLLFASIFSCLNPVLNIAVSLDFKDAFVLPFGKEKEGDMKRRELSRSNNSDHLVLHEAINTFEMASDKHAFCREYFLSYSTLNLLVKMKKQFTEYLMELEFVSDCNPKNPDTNYNSRNMSLVKAIVCGGLYPNVAIGHLTKFGKFGRITSTDGTKRYELHLKSVLVAASGIKSKLIVYLNKIKSTKEYIHDATVIYPLPVIFFGDNYQIDYKNGVYQIAIGDKLEFETNKDTANLINELRKKLTWYLAYKITHPGVVDWRCSTGNLSVLQAIMELITNEDTGVYEDYEDDDDDFCYD